MVIERVPKTNLRLKHLIKVYSHREDGPIPLVRSAKEFQDSAAIITASIDSATPIGTIQTLNLNSSRTNNIYRTLNSDLLGKIKEVYPSLPEYTGTVNNVALYTQHLVDAFQASTQDVFSGQGTTTNAQLPCFNIYNQIAPLIIKVQMLGPEGGTDFAADATKTIVLWDVWFESSNLEFNVTDDDLAVVQESNIRYVWLIAS
jgi:hypothetical protein